MRVIKIRTLKEFWEQSNYKDSEQPLKAWYDEAVKADWAHPNEIKEQYRSASILKDNRVVFNIHGNKYRLIVKIRFDFKIVYVRFIGTHEEYDKIDANEV